MSSMYFHYQYAFLYDHPIEIGLFEQTSPKDALCPVWLKLAQC